MGRGDAQNRPKIRSVRGYGRVPVESFAGMLQYSLNSRLSTAGQAGLFSWTNEAVAHLDKFRKKWKQKVRGFWDQVFNTGHGRIDRDAADMVEDAELAISEVNSGVVGQVYYTSVVVLWTRTGTSWT